MRAAPRLSRRLAVAAAAAAVALAIVAVASARWSTSGGGGGSATVGATAPLEIGAATPAAALYPGAAADVAVTIANPNRVAIRVPTLALDTARGSGGFAVDAAHAGCDVAALAFATADGDWTIPAAGSLAVSLPGALALAADAPDECQGATFTVYLEAR